MAVQYARLGISGDISRTDEPNNGLFVFTSMHLSCCNYCCYYYCRECAGDKKSVCLPSSITQLTQILITRKSFLLYKSIPTRILKFWKKMCILLVPTSEFWHSECWIKHFKISFSPSFSFIFICYYCRFKLCTFICYCFGSILVGTNALKKNVKQIK